MVLGSAQRVLLANAWGNGFFLHTVGKVVVVRVVVMAMVLLAAVGIFHLWLWRLTTLSGLVFISHNLHIRKGSSLSPVQAH